jgi:hypothetical protein
MNRRDLFKGLSALVAGIAVEQAVPLGRVWSFPTQIVRHQPGLYSVRYIQAFDIMRGGMVHRLDIGRDHELAIPSQAVHRGIAYQNVPGNRVLDAIRLMRNQSVELPDSDVLSKMLRLPEKNSITGMTWG